MSVNAFYLLFAFDQNSTGMQFYSKVERAGSVSVIPIVRQLNELTSFFDYENYKLFYDKYNLDSFLRTLEDNVAKNSLRKKLLSFDASNWNVNPPFKGRTKLNGTPVEGDTFSYLYMLHASGSSEVNAIIDMDAINGDYQGFCVEVLKPEIPVIHDWFTKNRVPKRHYHWSSKHGEFGKGNWPGESILMGSRQEAELLLPAAIGTKDKKDLYCFDKKYNKHMRFMPENVADTYHSFHIEEGEIDPHIKTVILEKLRKI